MNNENIRFLSDICGVHVDGFHNVVNSSTQFDIPLATVAVCAVECMRSNGCTLPKLYMPHTHSLTLSWTLWSHFIVWQLVQSYRCLSEVNTSSKSTKNLIHFQWLWDIAIDTSLTSHHMH